MYTRPVQDMSDTGAAIKAAREVQSDILAPELFRQASEWFFKAKREYKFKNFKLAKEFSDKARYYAEQAEFEAIRNGATRTDQPVADSYSDKSQSAPEGTPQEKSSKSTTPYPYPTPAGIPAEEYEQRMKQNTPPAPGATPPGAPAPNNPNTVLPGTPPPTSTVVPPPLPPGGTGY